MQFKTSFCNGPLFVHGCKRFWPLAAAVFLLVAGIMGLTLTGVSSNFEKPWENVDAVRNLVYGVNVLAQFGLLVTVFIAAALAFKHLHERVAIQFYQGLPVTRLCLYVTSYLVGMCLVAVPMAVALLLDIVLAQALGLSFVTWDLLTILCADFAALLILYSLAVLSNVLTGRMFGALLVYLAFNFAFAVIVYGCNMPAELFLPGIELVHALSDALTWATPYAKIVMALQPLTGAADAGAVQSGIQDPAALGVYAALAIVLAVIGAWAYGIRRAETAGNTVSFAPVQLVCKVLFSLVFSSLVTTLVLYLGFSGHVVSAPATVVILLVTAVFGWLVAEMLVQRSLRVFGRKTFVSCVALVVGLCVVGAAGILALQARVAAVPEPESVASAELGWSVGRDVTLEESGTSLYAANGMLGDLEVSPEDAVRVHRAVLDHMDLVATGAVGGTWAYASAGRAVDDIEVTYTLKDGSTLHRLYSVSSTDSEGNLVENEIEAVLNSVLVKPEYRSQLVFGLPDKIEPSTLHYASFESYLDDGTDPDDGDGGGQVVKDGYALYRAVLEDAVNGRCTNETDEDAVKFGALTFTVTVPNENRNELFQETQPTQERDSNLIEVTEEMTSTVSYLKKAGYIK